MKVVYGLVVASMFVLSACALDDAENFDEEALAVESPVTEVTGPDESATDVGADACYQTWICERCPGVPYRRDVLWEECDDGSRRIIMKTACGERDCF
jgi:hypothetical protein